MDLIFLEVGILLLIPSLVLYLALVIMAQEPGWNLVLLLGLSILCGALLNGCWGGANPWLTWSLFLALLGVVGIAVKYSSLILERSLAVLRPLTGLYLLGWSAIILGNPPHWIRSILVPAGLALFAILAAGIMDNGLKEDGKRDPTSLGIELWVILFNLFWLCSMV